MDRFQFWLYVIIGVVYFISRMRKKQKDLGKGSQIEGPPPTKNTVPKALSFEDLLREITQGKSQPAADTVVDYDDNLEDEEQDLEDVEYDYRKEDKVFETYENAKQQAFLRPSLEETIKLSDTAVGFGKFKEFDGAKGRNLAAEYLKDFRNPASLKKAVVLAEILKTKF